MKVAVIGAGSTYTPELVGGFLDRLDAFPLTGLWLMDIHPERLSIVGGFARRMVASAGSPFAVHLTTDQREAVRESNYVITQLRVGGMQARRADEYLGQRHGLIGQETTGVGGMAKALRTIPVVLSIAHDIHELAPGALLVNCANPAGLVTEALSRHAPDVPSVGVCNVPITAKMEFVARMERCSGTQVDPRLAELDTLGLNHLSWHRGLTLDGEDVWSQILDGYLAELCLKPDPEWDPRTIRALGMIPNYYLQYYYYTDRKLAAQEQWPPSRAEDVMVIEEELMAQYAEPDRTELPELLMRRGGAFYSTMVTELLSAHIKGGPTDPADRASGRGLAEFRGETLVVNVPHGGAIPGWPPDWVLEMPCRVGCGSIRPIPAEPLPAVCFGLLAQVKAYEILTVEAAVHGDSTAAYQALLAHPLGPTADRVQTVLDDMLETYRAYLPQFRK